MIKTGIILLCFCACLIAQDKNKTKIDSISSRPILIGICDREAFSDTNFSSWFVSEYESYKANEETISFLSDSANLNQIKIIIGTWCSDSRREVPRFYKILDEINFPEERIELIGVARDKKVNSINSEELIIEFVPTFIFYSDENEIGRIVEAPYLTLEEDMQSFIETILN